MLLLIYIKPSTFLDMSTSGVTKSEANKARNIWISGFSFVLFKWLRILFIWSSPSWDESKLCSAQTYWCKHSSRFRNSGPCPGSVLTSWRWPSPQSFRQKTLVESLSVLRETRPLWIRLSHTFSLQRSLPLCLSLVKRTEEQIPTSWSRAAGTKTLPLFVLIWHKYGERAV